MTERLFLPISIIMFLLALGAVGATALTGDVTGNTDNNTVEGIQGRTVSATTPSNNDCYIWNTSTEEWEPGACGAGTGLSNAFTRVNDVLIASGADDLYLQSDNAFLSWSFSSTEPWTATATVDTAQDWPNASTADALAANGTNCSANQFNKGVDASGNAESCAALVDDDVPDTITIDLATNATNLASDPTDCGANTFATAIDQQGDLTCSTPTLGTDTNGNYVASITVATGLADSCAAAEGATCTIYLSTVTTDEISDGTILGTDLSQATAFADGECILYESSTDNLYSSSCTGAGGGDPDQDIWYTIVPMTGSPFSPDSTTDSLIFTSSDDSTIIDGDADFDTLDFTFGTVTIDQMNDVGTSTETDGNILVWSSTQWVNATMSGDATINASGVITVSNAATADALTANGSNCPAGQAAGGVDASGAAEDCTDYIEETELDNETELETQLTDVTDVFTDNDGALSDDDLSDNNIGDLADVNPTAPNDAALLLYDTATGTWRDADMSGDATITDTGVIEVTQADALETDPADCGANTFAQSINTAGDLTCAAVDLGTADVTGTLDVSDHINLTAGRSLTLTGDDVAADDELYTKPCTWAFPPITSATQDQEFTCSPTPNGGAATITRLFCIVDTNGASVTIDERTRANTYSSGTAVNPALNCTTGGTTETTFDNAGIAAGSVLVLTINTVSTDNIQLTVIADFTVDD